jgi:hypothetical protein
MLVNDFISRAVSQYEAISWFDSLRSCMLLYFFIAFFILYVGGMITFFSGSHGIKNGKLILLFSVVLFIVGWSWVKLYQYYEIKTPVKKKVFDYRLAQALSVMKLKPELVLSAKGALTGEMESDHRAHPLEIRYTQDLWRNVGGIIPGTPVQTLRKIHPRTWFLEIKGKAGTATDRPLVYEFSARKDDDDSEEGYGVHLYDAKTHKPVDAKTEDQKKMVHRIRKAIDGTILKGSLSFEENEFIMKIFDNIENIRRWRKPSVLFKVYKNGTRIDKTGAPSEQAAFYGIDKILRMLPE